MACSISSAFASSMESGLVSAISLERSLASRQMSLATSMKSALVVPSSVSLASAGSSELHPVSPAATTAAIRIVVAARRIVR